ncbi:MAG TPA: hypothetical protein VMI13_10585 [Solirubrobacteraceae bacterium]|nr:hypothetical protein [Solirubrobacteraceae bacterium]
MSGAVLDQPLARGRRESRQRNGAPAPSRGASRLRRPPAWLLAAALAGGYLLLAPSSSDLAAASYRSWLFSHAGFSLWDNSWYGGHHLPAYSLLAPALGALIGPRLLVALAAVAQVAIFERLLAREAPGTAGRVAAWWFAFGAGFALLSSRVPYDLGLALGLAALLLARPRPAAALVLCVACSLASPVAGAFLALALLAWAIAGSSRRLALAMTAAALVPILALAALFPEGGTQPFVASAFWAPLGAVLLLAVLAGREQRVLRDGLVLYALVLVAAFVVPSAVGGNTGRLGSLLGGPVAALILLRREHGGIARGRLWLLVALTPLMLYWQIKAPLADVRAVRDNPSVESTFYAPLVAELQRLGVGYGARPERIEVVPTATHWEARWVAPHVMLARGWERQLDRQRNGLFYEHGPLTAAELHGWLLEQGVSLVALPDATLDYSGRAEARLLRNGPPAYLREVWRSPHWRLFAVRDPRPLVAAPGVLRSVWSDGASLRLPRAGRYLVRVRFTPYWKLETGDGCVERGAGGWTRVLARRAGSFRLGIGFSLARVLEHGVRCT